MTRPAGITQAEMRCAIRAQVRTGVPRDAMATMKGVEWRMCPTIAGKGGR